MGSGEVTPRAVILNFSDQARGPFVRRQLYLDAVVDQAIDITEEKDTSA
jgi:hypothetical protein